MKFLEDLVNNLKPKFEKGGKFEKLYWVFEGFESFLFQFGTTTSGKGVHVRDAIDLKRLMITVVVAMVPALIFGMWNVGHQHYLAIGVEADFWYKFWI